MPTFDEVIRLAKANSTPQRRIGIYPEAKKADPVMEDQILATLVRHGYGAATDAVFIQSFSDATLRSMDAKQAELGTAIAQILLGAAAALPDGTAVMRVSGGALLRLPDVASFTKGVGVSISNPNFPLTRSFIEQAHAAGLKVHGWTFAQPDPTLAADEYRRYIELGIDGVFSNYADLAVTARKRFVQAAR